MKSIEYRIFKMMLDSLLGAIENGEIDNQNDKVVQSYIKAQRYLGNFLPPNLQLPHPESFYIELFSIANALISKKKSPRDYERNRSTLYSNQTKFLELVIKEREEKPTESKPNYAGRVDFESSIKFDILQL